MSKINKIKLSGTTYDVEDANASKTVELTQAQYDALVSSGAVDSNTFYIITDASVFDPSLKVDTSAITSSVTSASTDSEIPTAKAVFDAIPTGGTSGGKAISAGTNISVTTGETADTVSCTLNLKNGAAYQSLGLISSDNIYGPYSVSLGNKTQTNNEGEAAFGVYNKYSWESASFGNSGNTLFSVGNGTSSARHNAFEIRQNGDIYLSSGGTDIKLQDHLGGGSITIDPTLDSGSTNAVANSAITTAINAVSGAIPTTTSAVTSGSTAVVESGAVYSQLGGLKLVKLTQTEYDNLGTKDSNTLYVITTS